MVKHKEINYKSRLVVEFKQPDIIKRFKIKLMQDSKTMKSQITEWVYKYLGEKQ